MPQLIQDDLDQARSLEGSVYDDWASWLRRLGAGDPMGGLSPMGPAGGMNVGAGIVRGADHRAFQQLLKTAPRQAARLQRSPSIIQYADTNPTELGNMGAHAATIPIGKEQAQQIIQAGGLRGVDLPASAYTEMAEVPGSTLQLYPRGLPISARTPPHEYGHAIKFARTGGETGIPSFTPEAIQRILDQAKTHGVRAGRYGGDVSHQVLDLISQLQHERTGGFNVR